MRGCPRVLHLPGLKEAAVERSGGTGRADFAEVAAAAEREPVLDPRLARQRLDCVQLAAAFSIRPHPPRNPHLKTPNHKRCPQFALAVG